MGCVLHGFVALVFNGGHEDVPISLERFLLSIHRTAHFPVESADEIIMFLGQLRDKLLHTVGHRGKLLYAVNNKGLRE